jgi:hypothetical protein
MLHREYGHRTHIGWCQILFFRNINIAMKKKQKKRFNRLSLRDRRKEAKKLAKLLQNTVTDLYPKVTRTGQLSI